MENKKIFLKWFSRIFPLDMEYISMWHKDVMWFGNRFLFIYGKIRGAIILEISTVIGAVGGLIGYDASAEFDQDHRAPHRLFWLINSRAQIHARAYNRQDVHRPPDGEPEYDTGSGMKWRMLRRMKRRKVVDSVSAFPYTCAIQYATDTREGLTSGFEMGPGEPLCCGRLTKTLDRGFV